MSIRFDPRERVTFVVGVTALMLLIFLPVLWASQFPPDDWMLYRSWTLGEDYTQYRSAMLQGYDGTWLIYNRFTSEPHHPVVQYPFYVLLGHLAHLSRLSLNSLYYGAAIVANVAFFGMLYVFSATFLPIGQERRLAWLLTLTVGPGWIVAIVQALFPTCVLCGRYASTFSRPEINTWLLLSAPPHLALSMAGMLWLWADLWRRHNSAFTFGSLARYAILVIALGYLNPFCLVPTLLPLGVWWILTSVLARKPLWALIYPLSVMGLAALPLVIYNYYTFILDPFWGKAYGSQNFQVSMPLDSVLLGYGLISVLAIWALAKYWRTQVQGHFLFTLALVLLLSQYLPVTYQQRFGFGLGPILAVLASPAWFWLMSSQWLHRLQQRVVSRVLWAFLLIMLFWGQNLAYYAAYASAFLGIGPTPRVVFQPRALAAAADYLGSLGSTAVILTQETTGNILAGEIRGRVVLGHAGATLDVWQKREEVSSFFAGLFTEEEQDSLLSHWGVTHVVLSPLTDSVPTMLLRDWPVVFFKSNVVVYEISLGVSE